MNEQNAKGILVVPDKDKETAVKDLGNDYPDVEIYSKSEIESLNPGLVASIIEELMRGRKEFRVNRQIILRSDKPPREKTIELVQNRLKHRKNRREKYLSFLSNNRNKNDDQTAFLRSSMSEVRSRYKKGSIMG